MIVVDVESSGLTPDKHSLLSVGALDFENPENIFYGECRIFEGAHVDKEALKVNGFSEEEIRDRSKISEGELANLFLKWAESIKEKTIAGHNPSFDRDFLQAAARRARINWPFAQRTVDLHSICFFHMRSRGVEIPLRKGHSALNLDTILVYAGLEERDGRHNAKNDTLLEAECFSRLMDNKWLIREYEKRPIPWKN